MIIPVLLPVCHTHPTSLIGWTNIMVLMTLILLYYNFLEGLVTTSNKKDFQIIWIVLFLKTLKSFFVIGILCPYVILHKKIKMELLLPSVDRCVLSNSTHPFSVSLPTEASELVVTCFLNAAPHQPSTILPITAACHSQCLGFQVWLLRLHPL